jgi:hypothetical protein
MQRVMMLIFLSWAIFFSGCCQKCKSVKEDRNIDTSKIVAGEYKIEFLAKNGSMRGHCTTGHIWLYKATEFDRSPRTGERPWVHEHRRKIRFYGAIDFDHKEIGAPIYPNKTSNNISIYSTDPIYPGVLVTEGSGETSKNTIMLTVGNLGNARNGIVVLDGDGIVLIVQEVSKDGFKGSWGPAGAMTDGAGIFCVRRITQ